MSVSSWDFRSYSFKSNRYSYLVWSFVHFAIIFFEDSGDGKSSDYNPEQSVLFPSLFDAGNVSEFSSWLFLLHFSWMPRAILFLNATCFCEICILGLFISGIVEEKD